MARPRWSLEIELDEPLLVPPVVGVAVVVRGPGLHQRGRLRAVAAVDPDGAPRPAVVSDPAPRAAGERAPAELLRVAGERLRLHLEEGAPVDHPALRAAADAAALWWEEEPARAAEVELLRARCLLAALEPAAAARAARPWVRRDGLPLLLRARLMAVGAWAAAEAGAADEAAVELDEALSALERRPRSCPEGVVLGRAVAALRAQLWVEGGTRTDRAELALLAALGPPEGWLALPEDPADAEGEVALLRWALSGACAPALRSALVKRHARWARRGAGLTERAGARAPGAAARRGGPAARGRPGLARGQPARPGPHAPRARCWPSPPAACAPRPTPPGRPRPTRSSGAARGRPRTSRPSASPIRSGRAARGSVTFPWGSDD
jgi:hypothetical protein